MKIPFPPQVPFVEKPSLAVLITCFNRREHTLGCLERLYEQARGENAKLFEMTVILVDDGSTDGTAKAVRWMFPEVFLLEGDGTLYWNRGMHRAFAYALEQKADYYLWLNDDTMLFPDALQRLWSSMQELERLGTTAIVAGSTCDDATGQLSYGGMRWRGDWLRQPMPVEPGTEPVACDTMNGNCTLIPHRIASVLGNLDPAFQHSFGDFDYGFRARTAGFPIYLAPGFFGTCSDNRQQGTWRDPKAGFRKRWQHLNSAKGSPFRQWSLYCRRHLGPLWPLYAVSPYVKTLASAVSWSR